MVPGLLNGSDRGLSDEEHSEQGCGTHHALTASDRRIDDRNGSRCVEIVGFRCSFRSSEPALAFPIPIQIRWFSASA